MRRSSFVSRLALACVLLAAMAGCGDSEKLPSVGGSCTLNSDCNNPLSCKFGKCHKQCNADRDCDLGQRCVKVDGKGICQLPEEKNCGPSVACMAPLACSSDNQCRTGCTTAADCLGTQTCVAGTAGGASVCAEPADRPSAAYDGGASGLDSGIGGGSADGGLGAPDAPPALSDVGGGFDGNSGAGIDTKSDANSVTLDAQPGMLPDGNTIVSDTRPDTTAAPDAPGAGGSGGTGGAGGNGGAGGDGGLPPDVASNQPDSGSYVPPAGPIVVDVTQASDPVDLKGREFYTINVGNTSTRAIANVKVLLRLPAGLKFNGQVDAEPDADCYNAACNPEGEAGWVFASLAAGERKTIVVNATVLDTVAEGDAITLSVTVTATGLSPITVAKTAHARANLSAGLTLDASKDPVAPNEPFSLDLDVGQMGVAPLANAELRLAVPAGLIIGTVSDGGEQSTPGQIVWTIGNVGVGASVHRKVDVTLDPAVPSGVALRATATLTFDGGQPIDATAEHAISAVAVATPLKLDVSVIGNPSVPKGRVLYTAVVGNTSTRAIDKISLLLRLPAGLKFDAGVDAEPNAGCYNNNCYANGEAPWTIGSLASGASVTINLSATVIDTVAGDGTLMTTLWQVFAPDQPTLSVSRTVQVFSHPAGQLYLSSSYDPLTPGQAFSLDIDVGQIGASALANSVVRLVVPAGLTIGTISDSGTQPSPGEIVWNVGTVAVSAAAHRKVDLTVDSSVLPGTPLTARASLAYDGGLAIDAFAEHTVSVIPVALPLTATVTATPNPVAPGGRLAYTMTINNTSARAVDGVAVLFRIPAEVHFNGGVDAEPDAGCYNNNCYANGEAPWTLGSIPAGTNKVITISAIVDTTVLEGSLISGITRVSGTGVANVIDLRTTVAAHK
jgi:hypothetical protein